MDGESIAFWRISEGRTETAAGIARRVTIVLRSRDRPLDGLRLERA